MFWQGFGKKAEEITGDADMEPGKADERSNNDYQDATPKAEAPISSETALKGFQQTGSDGYNEVKKAEALRKEVSTVAIIHEGKILMGKRRDNGKWTVPGGHLDPGEDPTVGAVREVFEESGVELTDPDFVGSYKADNGYTVNCFKAIIGSKASTSMRQDPDGEVYRWHWVKLPLRDEVRENMHVPYEKNCLMEAIGVLDKVEGAKKIKDRVKEAKVRMAPFVAMSDDVARAFVRSNKDREKHASADGVSSLFDSLPIAILLRKMAKEKLKGGKSDYHPDMDYPRDQLKKGQKVEAEHTDNKDMAKEISKDHLEEDPKYYDKLEKMEKAGYIRGVKPKTYHFMRGFKKRVQEVGVR